MYSAGSGRRLADDRLMLLLRRLHDSPVVKVGRSRVLPEGLPQVPACHDREPRFLYPLLQLGSLILPRRSALHRCDLPRSAPVTVGLPEGEVEGAIGVD